MRIRSLKNPKGLPSKNPENHGKSMIFQHLTLAPQARKKSSFCCFFTQSLCPGKAGFGGMLPDDEELPPVTDSEDEKPAYTTQCTNLERWQELPTKPGGVVWRLQCFYFLLFFDCISQPDRWQNIPTKFKSTTIKWCWVSSP